MFRNREWNCLMVGVFCRIMNHHVFFVLLMYVYIVNVGECCTYIVQKWWPKNLFIHCSFLFSQQLVLWMMNIAYKNILLL